MPTGTHHLESICLKCYKPKMPCNFFVREVAKIMEVQLPSSGNADALIGAASVHWRELDAAAAVSAANLGLLVIAGMTSKELQQHKGHVGIVLPGELLHGFPRVAATNEGTGHWGKSQGSTPLTEVFPAALVRANKVRYFARPAGVSGS